MNSTQLVRHLRLFWDTLQQSSYWKKMCDVARWEINMDKQFFSSIIWPLYFSEVRRERVKNHSFGFKVFVGEGGGETLQRICE